MESVGHEQLRQNLSKQFSCFVLVTCGEPVKNGKMDVEMIYEGDPMLASLMLEGAQQKLEDHCMDEDDHSQRYQG